MNIVIYENTLMRYHQIASKDLELYTNMDPRAIEMGFWDTIDSKLSYELINFSSCSTMQQSVTT
jgi:hypothetical protein